MWWESRIVPKRRTRLGFHALAILAAVILTCVVLEAAPASASTYTEQQGSHGGNAFSNYHNASGFGPRKINPNEYVQVSCKVYDPYIQSVNPDGYWYRIASSPWDDNYYSPANTFWNGDIPGHTPYTHNTDWAVPDCGASAPPPPPPPPPPTPTPSVVLARGPAAPVGYWYAISFNGFGGGSSVSVTCFDSVSSHGFRTFNVGMDGAGNAAVQDECRSNDGPDHWVAAGGTESNHVSWSSRSSTATTPGQGKNPTSTLQNPKSNGSGSGAGATTTPPPQPQSFASRRCSGDPSGHIVEALSAKPDQSGYKITIKPGDKGQVPWYADNDKIAAATRHMWNIVSPCLAALPLPLTPSQTTSIYYQLNCHFWGQRFASFGGTYDLETWRSATSIPTDNLSLQLFYIRTRCNWP